MKFIDEAIITVSSGKGGPGCVSFRREKFAPRGGPNGGNGGAGGNLIFKVNSGLKTLSAFRNITVFRAEDGHPGSKAKKSGSDGKNVTIFVPPGTLLWDNKTGALLHDLTVPGSELVLLQGGRGGKGNAHFKSSTYQAPKFAQPGEKGEELILRVELQLLADIGLIGFPNAGKSSLLSRVSAARPKIADYPFTTLAPQVGVINHYDKDLVMADIPGLIKGAHKGKGLGMQFLRHIRRTNRLLHLLDTSEENLWTKFEQINHELKSFDPSHADKPQTVVLTKIDLHEEKSVIDKIMEEFRAHGHEVIAISSATGEGLDKLYQVIFREEQH